MPVFLTDSQIQELLDERKPLPPDFKGQFHLRSKPGHKEQEIEIEGDNGSQFQIRLRQSDHNPLDFSVILSYHVPRTNVLFHLRRYNGKHRHRNKLEKCKFYGFHIHTATERYQSSGLKAEAFATPTTGYVDLRGAFDCMLRDCGFELPSQYQPELPFGKPQP